MSTRFRLCGMVLASAAVGLVGCRREPQPGGYVEGEVVKEYYSGSALVNSRSHIKGAAILGGGGDVNSVTLGSSGYGIKVEAPEGTYVISIIEGIGSLGPKNLLNTSAAIRERKDGEAGTKVRFATINLPRNPERGGLDKTRGGFSSDRVGSLDPDDLEILED